MIKQKSPSKKLKGLGHVSGWQDSNLRPPGPKPGAITGLRYIPNLNLGKELLSLRRGWDSNPRYSLTRTTI